MHPAKANQKTIFLILGIGLALSLLGDSTLYAVLPDPAIAGQVGISLGTVGVLLGLNRLTRLALNTPAGLLYERLPRRVLMVASLSLGALSTLVFALGDRLGWLVLSRILWGAAWSGLWVGANMIVLDVATQNDRGAVSGRLQTAFLLGIAFSSAAGGFFTDLFGFRPGLLVSAGLSVVGVLYWILVLPETIQTRSPRISDGQTSWFTRPDWGVIFRAGLPYFLIRLIFAGVISATTILWLERLISTPQGAITIPLATLTGVFIAGRVLVSISGALWFGRLSDQLGNRIIVLAGLLVLSAVGLGLMAVHNSLIAITGAFLAAIASGAIPLLSVALIGDRIVPSQQGRTLGIVLTVGDLGSAIGPPLALGLFTQVGIPTLYLICAVTYLVGAVLLGLFRPAERYASSPNIE